CAGVAVAHPGECTDAGASDAGTGGVCTLDTDCVFRPTAGCCGACMAKTDPVPTRTVVCGILCPAIVPNCGCVNNKCAAKALCVQPLGTDADAGGKVAIPIATDAGICPAI